MRSSFSLITKNPATEAASSRLCALSGALCVYTDMANGNRIIRRAFNAGEISKQAKWRNDLEKHAYACECLENFYVNTLGGVSRRAGTRFLGALGSENVRLVPFEYNRELSDVLCFYADANGAVSKWVWKTEKFSLPAVWTMCWTIPASVDGAKNVLTKGNLTVSIDASANLIVSTDAATAIADVPFGAEHKVAVVRDGTHSISIYVDGELKGSNGNFVFTDDGGCLVVESMGKGDTWGLKVLNYAITRSDAWYKLQDFSDGKDETAMIIKTPNWDGQESLYGSTVENGVLKYDWEAAAAKRLVEVRANVDLQSLHGTIVSTEAHIAELEALINNQGGGEGAAEALQAAKASLATNQVAFQTKCAEECGASSWSALLAASGLESSEILYGACMNGDYPIVSVNEVITVPFPIIKDANIVYSATANGVSATLGGKEIVSGVAAIAYSNFRLAFAMTADYACSYICKDFRASFYSLLQSLDSFWASNEVVKLSAFDVDGNAICTGVSTPIPAETLNEFQYKQVGGDIYFVHSSFLPQKLSVGGGDFVWSNAVNIHPSIDTPVDGLVLKCSGGGASGECFVAGDCVAITSDKDFFELNMVGAQFKVDYVDGTTHTYVWHYPSAGAVSASYPSCGEVTVTPQGGVWDGVLLLEESTDGGKTWAEIGRTTSIQGSDNTALIREVYNVQSLVRCRLSEQNKVLDTSSQKVEAATEGCRFNISRKGSVSCWFEITAVNSPTNATVKFLNPTRKNWVSTAVYQSCWGDKFGYPRTVDIHEERLALGGNRRQPATVWLSQTNNWENFRSVSNLDTDPLAYTLASDDGEPISWIVSKNDLMIGLGSAEWSLGSRDASQSLTSSIIRASNQSEDGVEYAMPAKADNMVIYVRRGGRELGSITYDFASDAYNSISLTTLCPEILGDGVKAIFNQLSPKNRIWAVRDDGVCGVFTYDRENNVSAWSRFTFGDGVISACAVSTGRFKSVFLAVKRGGHLCLERLAPNEAGTDNWLDCVPISANAEVPEGLETSVAFTSKLKTMPFFVEGQNKVFALTFYMLSSMGGSFRAVGFNGDDEERADAWEDFHFKEDEIFEQNKAARDFRYRGYVNLEPLEECAVEVRTDYPAPFNLCAIAAKI